MSAAPWLAAAAVAISGCALAAGDARRCRISYLWSALLTVAGLHWWVVWEQEVSLAAIAPALAGLALGIAGGAGPMVVATIAGRRWPLESGDLLLLAAIGCVLGPDGLVWGLAAGCVGALLHRRCVQRKRGRPFGKGGLPLAPGMMAGALTTFAVQAAGVLPRFGGT